MHTPLSTDDCTPNKALRLTVKAFLKNEEKKRDKLKVESAPPAPVAPTPMPAQKDTTENGLSNEENAEIKAQNGVVQSIEQDDAVPADATQAFGDSADSSTVEVRLLQTLLKLCRSSHCSRTQTTTSSQNLRNRMMEGLVRR